MPVDNNEHQRIDVSTDPYRSILRLFYDVQSIESHGVA